MIDDLGRTEGLGGRHDRHDHGQLDPEVVGGDLINPGIESIDGAFEDLPRDIIRLPIVESSAGAHVPRVNPPDLETHLQLPPLALEHLRQFPYRAPHNVDVSSVWFEGTFDPLGEHHIDSFLRTLDLGFERAVLGIVFQNPFKPNSSPYEHRYEMGRRALEERGLNVVDDPSQPGVCIFRDETSFHAHRAKVLFDRNTYILIGPDNFNSAIQNNTLWVHPPEIRENPSASEYYGFRSLCERVHGFRSRVLVYPILHNMHATDIREGRVAPPKPVAEYVTEHGLYAAKAGSGPALKPQASLDPRQKLSSDDLLSRHRIETDVCLELSRLGLLTDPVRHAVYKTLADFDPSQVLEVDREFAKLKSGDPVTNEAQTVDGAIPFVRPLNTIRRLREEATEALLRTSLQCEGTLGIHESLRQGQKIIFIGNHSGWGDIPLLTSALSLNGLGAVSENVSFVLGDEVYSDPFARTFYGRSVRSVPIPLKGEFGGQGESPLARALGKAISRLEKDGALTFFPESLGSSNGITLFGHALIDFLSPASLGARGIDPASLVIIPWAQRGGSAISQGKGAIFSEEAPPFVRFGAPIPVTALNRLSEVEADPASMAHLIGLKVAELLPAEHRGVYGPYGERYLTHPQERYRILPTDLESIQTARELFEMLGSNGGEQSAIA